jgi:hypothetical protein
MRTAIVDLDTDTSVPRGASGRPRRSTYDRGVIAGLAAASTLFAAAVWLAPPAAPSVAAPAGALPDVNVSSATVPRGVVLHPLALPPDAKNVDLGILPERLANEAAPYQWRRVITVRGIPGVASAEGLALISWSEKGIVYWISSPSRTTEELIQIADDMR